MFQHLYLRSLTRTGISNIPTASPTDSRLRGSKCLRLARLAAYVTATAVVWSCTGYAAETQRSLAPASVLSTCRAAHDISLQEAAKGYPVHLHAVVTFYDADLDPRHAALFVHDSTGSIFMALPSRPVLPLKPGTLVEVNGRTGTGDYAPVVLDPTVRVLGVATLPKTAPRPAMEELLSGRQDGQWIEIEGIVEAARTDAHTVTFEVHTPGGTVPAAGPIEPGVDYERFIDAMVRIRGNAVPVFNDNRQMVGARLLFPSIQVLKNIEPGATDPYAAPIIPFPKLLQFIPGVVLRHRSHVRGTVTLYWPGRLLCIQQSRHGLCMLSDHREAVRLGDLVDVVGFPAIKDFKPTLENTKLRVIDKSAKVSPEPVVVDQALRRGYDQNLIQIDGELIGQDRTTGDLALELRSGNSLFSAVLPNVGQGSGPSPWKDGSSVRLTGICEVLMDPRTSGAGSGAVQPGTVRILLRTDNDVAILHAPSWWTRGRVLALLAAVGLIALAAVAWSVSLRRRVERQTELIRQNEERLRHLSEHDVLTGLPNRCLLNDRLDMAIKQSVRSQRIVGILMIDLDRFKEINDTLGHHIGDLVLCDVATRLMRSVRATDTVARLGGDEFIVVLPDLNDPSEAEFIASKIVALMREPVFVEGVRVEISASVGVGTSLRESPDAETLLQRADSAMYEAKRCGRNRYQLSDAYIANHPQNETPA